MSRIAPKKISAVSVVIPTYNRRESTIRALESILNQDWPGDIECIVTDNASTDGTSEAVKLWMNGHPSLEIRLYEWRQNVGPIENWRRALDLTSHEWVKVLWSDDWLNGDALRLMCDAAALPEVSVVTSGCSIDWEGSSKIQLFCEFEGEYSAEMFLDAWIGSPPTFPLSPSAGLMRRNYARAGVSLAKDLGDCSQKAIGPDLCMLYWPVFQGLLGYHINQPLAHFSAFNGETEDPSITTSTRSDVLRTCYDAAIRLLISETDIQPSNLVLRELRHRAFESQVMRTPNRHLLHNPRLSFRLLPKSLGRAMRLFLRKINRRKHLPPSQR